MITDTTFKTLTLAIATYVVFFAYSVSKNPVLECLLTILLMVNLSILTYASSQNDFMENYFHKEIYDDVDSDDDDEDECDDNCECETPRTETAETAATDNATDTLSPEAATLSPEAANATDTLSPEAATLSPEELAKVNLDLTVNNEPPPFSVRALVRAFDTKSSTNLADLSGGLPPCSHDLSAANLDISGATTTM